MGQYYRPCVLAEDKVNVKATVVCYDYGNGAKLMEHSYIGNGFVEAVESLIDADSDGTMAGSPFVWAGDYADGVGEPHTVKEEGRLLRNDDGSVRMVQDNWYDLSHGKETKPQHGVNRQYAINRDKKLYVDLFKAKEDSYGYRINALPILCSAGNGRGGGDYSGTNMELVGSWAGDVVVVSNHLPKEEGYSELEAPFSEDR